MRTDRSLHRMAWAISTLLILLGVAAAVAMVVANPSAGAASGIERISADRHASEISAFNGALVWSHDSTRKAAYRLIESVGGRAFPAPVRPAVSPFQADLGPSEIGSPLAVFSRCRKQAPSYDCDIRGLDLTQAITYRVAGAAGRRCAEGTPSVWRSTVAFSRHPRGGGIRCRVGLFVSRGGEVSRLARRIPVATDLSGEQLAAAFVAPPKGASGNQEAVSHSVDSATRSWIKVYDLASGNSRVVASGALDRRGRGDFVLNPVLDRGTLYYLLSEGSRLQRIVGQRVAPGGADVVTDFLDAEWFSADRGRIYFTNRRGVFRLPG